MQEKLSTVNDLSCLLDGAVGFLCIDDQAFSVDIFEVFRAEKNYSFFSPVALYSDSIHLPLEWFFIKEAVGK